MAKLRGAAKEAWERTVRLHQLLRSGGEPDPVPITDFDIDDVCYADIDLEYARLYSPEITVSVQQTVPRFTINPMRKLRDSLDAAAARREFERAQRDAAKLATPRWHSEGVTRVILTDERLLCEVGGQWLEFGHGSLTGVTIDVADWAVELAYADTPPLRLSGLDAPGYGLVISWLIGGPQALETPKFAMFESG